MALSPPHLALDPPPGLGQDSQRSQHLHNSSGRPECDWISHVVVSVSAVGHPLVSVLVFPRVTRAARRRLPVLRARPGPRPRAGSGPRAGPTGTVQSCIRYQHNQQHWCQIPASRCVENTNLLVIHKVLFMNFILSSCHAN